MITSILALAKRIWSKATHPRGDRGRVPRTHPFGWGRSCDGCDAVGQLAPLTNGGHYCDDCAAYVIETAGALPVPPPTPIRREG